MKTHKKHTKNTAAGLEMEEIQDVFHQMQRILLMMGGHDLKGAKRIVCRPFHGINSERKIFVFWENRCFTNKLQINSKNYKMTCPSNFAWEKKTFLSLSRLQICSPIHFRKRAATDGTYASKYWRNQGLEA